MFQIKQEATNPNRPLPLDRSAVEEFELGYKEPSRVPYGKITLKNALRFISHHQSDPKEYTAEKIAEEYNLSEEAVSGYYLPLSQVSELHGVLICHRKCFEILQNTWGVYTRR